MSYSRREQSQKSPGYSNSNNNNMRLKSVGDDSVYWIKLWVECDKSCFTWLLEVESEQPGAELAQPDGPASWRLLLLLLFSSSVLGKSFTN